MKNPNADKHMKSLAKACSKAQGGAHGPKGETHDRNRGVDKGGAKVPGKNSGGGDMSY
jgi:hypothetical protein